MVSFTIGKGVGLSWFSCLVVTHRDKSIVSDFKKVPAIERESPTGGV
jgi:hypothetical protein